MALIVLKASVGGSMDSGYYAACTALVARTQALDVVANNLANTSTSGYRAQHGLFQSVLASASQNLSPLNEAINNYGVIDGNRLDLSQGSLEHTSNDLDFAIQGNGFFVVQSPTGRLFTRNGGFQVSPQGQLITSDGFAVMGANGPIRVMGGPVSVSEDGTISVNGAVAGKLSVVEFGAGTQLEAVGNSYYSAPARSDVPSTGSRVQQGMLEHSNVNPIASTVDLISVQRHAEMAQRALSVFDSEFNRTAMELLRVDK
jgi:flagellar basal-body rod protein FlgF/flagellar basal-body rod protein FlgG